MRKILFVAVACAFVATPAFANLVLTYDASAMKLTYTAATKILNVTETDGSNFMVRKEDNVAGTVVDNTQLPGTAYSLLLHLDLVDLSGANNWSGTGSFVFTDTGSSNVVEAAVQTVGIVMTQDLLGSDVLTIYGKLSDLGSNTRILVGSDPWVFNGQSEIAGEPTEGTANQITMFDPEAYDSGSLLTIKFGAPGGSLDGLFEVDRTLYAGEVKGEVVPVPAAVLLGFLGLGAAGLKLRRFA